MKSSRILAAGLAVSGVAALAGAGVASAHTHVTASTPKHGSAVAKLPKTATITFGEAIGRVGNVRITRDGRGNYTKAARLAPGNARRVVVTLKNVAASAQKGTYRIVWNITGADGHAQKGVIAFRVR